MSDNIPEQEDLNTMIVRLIKEHIEANGCRFDGIYQLDGEYYTLVRKDTPKKDRFVEIFQEPNLYQLKRAIQSRIVEGRVRVEPGA